MAFGSSGSNDVEITVRVDAEGVATVLDKTGQEIAKLEKASDGADSALSRFSASMTGLNQGLELVQKAFGFVTGTTEAFFSAIQQGAAVDDITQSFQNLSAEAGVAGDALLSKFGDALGNTIPKVDQMRAANELLLGGLDPSQFELVAKAARSFAEVTGGSAAEGMNALSDSLLRGNDRALKTLGIVVDNQKALEDFAASIGTTSDKLSEQGKVLALREASLKALSEQQGRLGEVAIDAGDRIDQFTSALADSKNEALQALASNESLNEALAELARLAATIDFARIANGLAEIAAVAIKATTAVGGFGASIAKWLGSFTEDAQLVSDELDQIVGLLEKDTPEAAKKATAAFNDLMGRVNDAGLGFAVLANVAPMIDTVGEAVQASAKRFGFLTKETVDYKAAIQATLAPVLRFKGGLTTTTNEADKLGDELKKITAAVDEATGRDSFPELTRQIEQAFAQNNAAGADQIAQSIEAIAQQALAAKVPLDEILKRVKELSDAPLFGPGNDEGLAEYKQQMDEIAQASSDMLENLGAELISTIGDALIEGLDNGFNSDQLKDIARSGGAAVGSAFGGAMAGPMGAAFGGVLGELYGKELGRIADIGKNQKGNRNALKGALNVMFFGLGSVVDSVVGDQLFGGNSAGTEAKKSLDKYFADLFDEQRIAVIINGKLEVLEDLVFSGNQDGGGIFAGMEQGAQSAFTNIGNAMSELLGVGTDLAVNLGSVLANNLGGSLNNLQLLIQGMGVSFEQLKEQTVNAFLAGDLTATQALTTLQQIQNISQQGIPDGIGMIEQAVHNLEAAGIHGGAALVDALGDIGAEAQELGIKDLAQLRARLQQLGFSAEELDILFQAFADNSIDSVQALTDATAEQLLPVLADLENHKFPFSEAAAEAQGLIEQVKKLPEEIRTRVVVDVETNYPDDTPAVVKDQLVRSSSRSFSAPRPAGPP